MYESFLARYALLTGFILHRFPDSAAMRGPRLAHETTPG